MEEILYEKVFRNWKDEWNQSIDFKLKITKGNQDVQYLLEIFDSQKRYFEQSFAYDYNDTKGHYCDDTFIHLQPTDIIFEKIFNEETGDFFVCIQLYFPSFKDENNDNENNENELINLYENHSCHYCVNQLEQQIKELYQRIEEVKKWYEF